MTLKEKKVNLQVNMMYYLVDRWKISFREFLNMDKKYGILRDLSTGYSVYKLSGDEGIAEELERHIREQVGSI